MWPAYSILPSYFGGKRKLNPMAFRELNRVLPRKFWSGLTFLDAFLGGGSVSLYAKAMGFGIVCNDISQRSHIIGKAVIENNRTMLCEDDLLPLFQKTPNDSFVQKHYSPDVFTTAHASFLDYTGAYLNSMPDGTKKYLLKLLMIKFIMNSRVFGNFGAKTINRQVDAGDFENMKERHVEDVIGRGMVEHPFKSAKKLLKTINGGVFDNGQINQAHKSDVFSFLSMARGSVLFLDPPYAGTQSYEKALQVLDSILEGQVIVKPEKSVFSKKDGYLFLEGLFEKAEHIPVWILTYGNAVIGRNDLVKMMAKYRPNAYGIERQYTHCMGLMGNERKEKNREIVVVGYDPALVAELVEQEAERGGFRPLAAVPALETI